MKKSGSSVKKPFKVTKGGKLDLLKDMEKVVAVFPPFTISPLNAQSGLDLASSQEGDKGYALKFDPNGVAYFIPASQLPPTKEEAIQALGLKFKSMIISKYADTIAYAEGKKKEKEAEMTTAYGLNDHVMSISGFPVTKEEAVTIVNSSFMQVDFLFEKMVLFAQDLKTKHPSMFYKVMVSSKQILTQCMNVVQGPDFDKATSTLEMSFHDYMMVFLAYAIAGKSAMFYIAQDFSGVKIEISDKKTILEYVQKTI